MFASKAQPDRFPHRVGPVRLAYPGTLNGEQSALDPRPFDPTMHNEPNPVLVAHRGGLGDAFGLVTCISIQITLGGFPEWADPRSPMHVLAESTREQLIHARRVLARLGRLEES